MIDSSHNDHEDRSAVTSFYDRVGGTATRWLVAAALVAALLACSPSEDELLVFAAASLADALEEIAAEFEREGATRVAISSGGSQMLAQQIAGGAPADLFVSAGEFPVRFLRERRLLEPSSARLLSNEMVVVVPVGGDEPASMDGLGAKTVRRIAIADPELAPAGRYARESLMSLGLWDGLGPKLVFAADVRAALAYVESGNADAALVYRTDAEASERVRVLHIVPAFSYSPISYPAVIVAASNNKVAADAFLRYLRGEGARETFRRHGFVPSPVE
jgi:molybdate transport system substrate-binding protein